MSSKITVSYGENSSYDIIIKKGILSSVGEMTRPLTKAKRVAIITDSNVAPLYFKKVIDSFKSADFDVCSFAFTAGEPSKNLETVNKILECFAVSRLTRSDIAVANSDWQYTAQHFSSERDLANISEKLRSSS